MTITEQLLTIESEAQEAIKDIEKQNAELTKAAQKSLQKKIAQIEAKGTEEIKRIAMESENHTARRIEEVKEKYRKKMLHDVLYGGKL
ncbi:MAG: hypothetical protein FWB80_10995 [Defluviitaleaceae bacterium]|nr:hypothetical protein [Defluviitaleaceae bacterium]